MFWYTWEWHYRINTKKLTITAKASHTLTIAYAILAILSQSGLIVHTRPTSLQSRDHSHEPHRDGSVYGPVPILCVELAVDGL